MRIRIGGHGPVSVWGFVHTDSRTNIAVMIAQAAKRRGIFRAFYQLFHGQGELRHHVPVNAPQTFVLIERARAAGERLVIEDLLVQVEHVTLVSFRDALESSLQ